MSRTTTLAENVHAELKRRIISLSIPPGSFLTEGELARQFSLSKTPVREALARLQREGHVEVTARFGYRVAAITLKDTNDLFGLRMVLEAEATALAAAAPKDSSQLRGLEDRSDASFNPDNPESISEYLTQNTAFHVLIAQIGGNLRLAALLESVLTDLERVIHLSLSLIPIETVHDIEHTHEELMAAIVSGDADAARRLSHSQNRAFEARIIDALLTSPVLLTTNLGGMPAE